MSIAAHHPPPAIVNRTYLIHTCWLMGGYAVINIAAIFGFFDDILGRPVGWIIAVAVALPVAGQIWATLRLMAHSDEYVRVIIAKSFVIAAGISMTLWTVWGFGETYAVASHIPGWLIYPFFWTMYGLVSCFVRRGH